MPENFRWTSSSQLPRYNVGWTPASGVLAGTESSSHRFEALARQLSFDIHAGTNLCYPRYHHSFISGRL